MQRLTANKIINKIRTAGVYLPGKPVLIRSIAVNIILGILLLFVLFNTAAKSFLLSGLLLTGLYHPDTTATKYANLPAGDDVQFADISGNRVSLTELKGKVVYINFWATWCPPCRAEMPSIEKLYRQFSGDSRIVFLIVDADGNLSKAQHFMNKKQYTFPLYAVASSIPRQLYSGSLPTTVVLDKAGLIVYSHKGMADYGDERFKAFLEGIMK